MNSLYSSWRSLGSALVSCVALPFATASSAFADVPSKIVFVHSAEPTSTDCIGETDVPAHQIFCQQIMEPLVQLDPEPTPWLATSWKQTSPTTWEYTLREDVNFSNGDHMTSDDVVASVGHLIGTDQHNNRLGSLMSARAVSQYVVELTTKVPDAFFPYSISRLYIAPKSVLAKYPEFKTLPAVGSGPFTLENWDHGVAINMKANPNYWGQKPAFQDLQFIWRAESTVRALMVSTGEAQVAYNLSPEDVADLKNVSTQETNEIAGLRWNTIGVPQESVFQNQDVRRAANLAIDRDAVAKELYAGYMNLSGGMPVSLTMAGVPTDVAPNPFPYDMKEAQRLIEKAGAKGKKITIMSPQGRWPRDTELLDYIANQLRQAGLDVKVNIVEYALWNAEVDYFRKGTEKSDAILNFSGNEIPDAAAKADRYMACQGNKTVPGSGAMGICLPEADKLIEQAMSEFDVNKRNELSKELIRMHIKNDSFLSIGSVAAIVGLTDTINWKPTPALEFRLAQLTAK